MSAPVRIAAFVAVLTLVFAVSWVLGSAIGPDVSTTSTDQDHPSMSMADHA